MDSAVQIYSSSLPDYVAEEPLFDHFGNVADVIPLQAKIPSRSIAQKIELNATLNRRIVSFQASKNVPIQRWYKYKEGFSVELVNYLLDCADLPSESVVLDPFNGSGTTPLTALKRGFHAIGFELLPSIFMISQCKVQSNTINKTTILEHFNLFQRKRNILANSKFRFKHIAITESAFPDEVEYELSSYFRFCDKFIEKAEVKLLFDVVAMSVLEDCSYTRKDGQYLRWDSRSAKKQNTKYKYFSKGHISSFYNAFDNAFQLLLNDLEQQPSIMNNRIDLRNTSCLFGILDIPDESVSAVITSPPYCNRYDYTRTYALELAFCGLTDSDVKQLRQNLLSATVENRTKRQAILDHYEKYNRKNEALLAYSAVGSNESLISYMSFIEEQRSLGLLNNPNLVGMIQNYIEEISVLIGQLFRVCKPNSKIYIVNDNVQYNGRQLELDVILSEIAQKLGFVVDSIWQLPKGKGNSSQQMGRHGRTEVRKCIYVWRKP